MPTATRWKPLCSFLLLAAVVLLVALLSRIPRPPSAREHDRAVGLGAAVASRFRVPDGALTVQAQGSGRIELVLHGDFLVPADRQEVLDFVGAVRRARDLPSVDVCFVSSGQYWWLESD